MIQYELEALTEAAIDLVEVAKLIPGNQVPSHSVRVRFETPC